MLYQTSPAHEELRMKVREFAEKEVKPIAFSLDKNNEFPRDAVRKMGELGLMGLPYETEYGGAGADVLSYAIAVEELARVDGGTGVILSAHTSLGTYPIAAFGTEEQKRKYLPDLCSGRKVGAVGLTEVPTPEVRRPSRKIRATIICSTATKSSSRTAARRILTSCSPSLRPVSVRVESRL